MKARICISVEEEILEILEVKRGDIPRSRFIERLIRQGIDFDVGKVVGYA